MERDDVLERLQLNRTEWEALGVASLSVFGSVARGEARPDSDVDILVSFSKPVGLIEFIHLQQYLTDLLGRPVDLATEDALRPTMRPQILEDAIHA